MATLWIRREAAAWLSCTSSTSRALETTVICSPADGYQPLYDQAALDAAVAAEREACAKLCESNTTDINIAAGVIDRFGLVRVDPHYASRHAGTKYAAAIRGRGELAKDQTEPRE